jgi:hypothetical protein
MKDDLLSGGRLWGGAKEKRDQRSAAEQRRGEDKVVPLVSSDREYVAFEIKENPKRLHIRTALQGSFYPSYHHLADIRFDHDHQTYFTLIYNFMAVKVSGQNLGAVVHAIDSADCKRIHEFHPKLHDRPERDEPLIEKLEVLTKDGEDY